MEQKKEPTTTESWFDGRAVLIAEDDYFLADDLCRAILKRGGSVLGPAASLEEALSLAGVERIDGALLDIGLDDGTAYEVADMLVARGIPIVFVSGYDRTVLPARFADTPFCQKPIAADAALDTLERIAAT